MHIIPTSPITIVSRRCRLFNYPQKEELYIFFQLVFLILTCRALFPLLLKLHTAKRLLLFFFFFTKLTKRAKNHKENRNNDGKRVELFECFVYFYRAASHQNPLVSAICSMAFRFSLKLSRCFSFCD